MRGEEALSANGAQARRNRGCGFDKGDKEEYGYSVEYVTLRG